MAEEDGPLLNEKQVAEYLNLSLRTVRRWRAEGIGPPYVMMAGRYPRYRRADIDQWLQHRAEQEDS
jgi:excisionase family DNA binding protein